MPYESSPEDSLTIQTDSIELGDELSGQALAKLAAVQALNASVVNEGAYVIAVDNFEATLSAKLDKVYNDAIKAKDDEARKEGGVYYRGRGQVDLARVKFRELMALIERLKPRDEILKT